MGQQRKSQTPRDTPISESIGLFSGHRLRGHRERLSLTRPALSARSGVTVAMIVQLEKLMSWPSHHTQMRLTEALQVRYSDLLRVYSSDIAEYQETRHPTSDMLADIETAYDWWRTVEMARLTAQDDETVDIVS